MQYFKPVTIAALILGILIGIGVDRYRLLQSETTLALSEVESTLEHAHKHIDTVYICPMHPGVVAHAPGKCPVCGMDLVRSEREAPSDAASGAFPEVHISPGFMQNFGVHTAIVERGPVAHRIEAIGRVSRMPQPRVTGVMPGLAGKLVDLTGKEVGDEVHQGEQLFAVDAPEWRQLQQRYLETLADENDTHRVQLEQRLRTLGMTAGRLERLRNEGQVEQILAVFAPIDGTIVERSPGPGEAIDAQSKVVTLGGINRVPVLVSVFEGQGAWIDRGQRVTVRVPTLPGTEFIGQVDRTDREINFSSHTLPVYVGFNTADPRIRYGMLVEVTIEAAVHENALRIPREALIRTGAGDRVILASGKGHFQPVEVVAGLESGEFIEILSGLQAGQEVVVSGQFLIDSESSLRTSLQRMGEDSDAP